MKHRTKIAQRMWHIHLIDTELERGLCQLKLNVKYGYDYFYGLMLKRGEIKNDR